MQKPIFINLRFYFLLIVLSKAICAQSVEQSFSFTPTSVSSGELTGAPSGVTATFKNTYNKSTQLTDNKSMTLTIKGLGAEYRITGIQLHVRTNQSSGKGHAVARMNGIKFGTYNYDFNSTTYRDVDMTVTPTDVQGDLVITINCTEASIYCSKFTVFFEERPPLQSVTISGSYQTSFSEGSDFNHDGMLVTANYEDNSNKNVSDRAVFSGYDMNTSGTQTVTVSYTGGEITKSAQYDILVNSVPRHKVVWNIDGERIVNYILEGASIVFPANPEDIDGKEFVGWTTTPIDGSTDDAPTFVTNATMGTSNLSYFAVFATKTEGNLQEITDEVTRGTTGVGSSDGYTSWSGKTVSSGAVYAGKSGGSKSSIQLRNTDNSGFITTASSGKAKSISVMWNSNTTSTGAIIIYGKNTPYTSTSKLYDTSDRGTELGRLEKNESNLIITDDYEYIGIRSESGVVYLTSISITWECGHPDSFSKYCTTVSNHAQEVNDQTTFSIYDTNEEVTHSGTTTFGRNIKLSSVLASNYDGTILKEMTNSAIANVSFDNHDIIITPKVIGTTTITFIAPETNNFDGEVRWEYNLVVNDIEPKNNSAVIPSENILSESFDSYEGTGGNGDDGFVMMGNSISAENMNNDVTGWTFNEAFEANKCVMFGTSERGGSATTPEMSVTSGSAYVLRFSAAPWDSEESTIILDVSGATISGITHIETNTMDKNKWNQFEYTLNTTDNVISISFSCSQNRFYLDEISVVKPSVVPMNPQVTISSSGYGSFCYEYPIDFTLTNEDYNAWYVCDIDDNTVYFKKIDSTIKGGVPFILYGKPGNYELTLAEESTYVPNGNLLVGTLTPTYIVSNDEKTNYGLSGGYFVPIYDGVVKANKAYLPISIENSNARLAVAFDEMVNGLSDKQTELTRKSSDQEYYNLSGHLVNQLKKGHIYIVNGKTIIKK